MRVLLFLLGFLGLLGRFCAPISCTAGFVWVVFAVKSAIQTAPITSFAVITACTVAGYGFWFFEMFY